MSLIHFSGFTAEITKFLLIFKKQKCKLKIVKNKMLCWKSNSKPRSFLNVSLAGNEIFWNYFPYDGKIYSVTNQLNGEVCRNI